MQYFLVAVMFHKDRIIHSKYSFTKMWSGVLSLHIVCAAFLNMSENMFTQNENFADGKILTLSTLTSVKFIEKDRQLKNCLYSNYGTKFLQRNERTTTFLISKSYTNYKFTELLFLGAIIFFRNALGQCCFIVLHSFISFLHINKVGCCNTFLNSFYVRFRLNRICRKPKYVVQYLIRCKSFPIIYYLQQLNIIDRIILRF